MTAFVILLLVLAIVFGVFGFVVKGLLWLAFIGIALFIIAAVWGWVRRKASN